MAAPLRGIWLQNRDRLSLGLFAEMLTGKALIALGLGALLARWLAPWAVLLIVLGLVIDGQAKWRWLRRR